MRRLLAPVLLLAALCAGAASPAPLLGQHFESVRAQLDERVQAALAQMQGLDRQLLATRSYLRAGNSLESRWSWTAEQISQWQGSEAQTARDAEIHKVRLAFEQANPGYTLFVNPQVRSLDLQLQRWNTTSSVTRASEHLAAALRAEVHRHDFPEPGTSAATERITALIRDHRVSPVPTLAAPGLSAHGRMGAVDFHILQGNRTVAGPESSQVKTVWEAQGWAAKLKEAVFSASDRFEGPLESPAEPWHFDYLP